ncbi:hypothetical protein ABB02_00063 [Clostridiaceae bacterium JG1575]|nr:hypothetical protein ABB02_00063 [Clostridiaceae bacterium JG1575]
MERKEQVERMCAMDDDLQRNEAFYQLFCEEHRLRGRVGRVEFLTTMKALAPYLTTPCRILDFGAGTGAYSIPLAQMGHQVTALEPAPRNRMLLEGAREQLDHPERLQIYPMSSKNLKEIKEGSFDLVLLLGPLYHLTRDVDQFEALMEARRLARDGASFFINFINHDMIPITETLSNPQWFLQPSFHRETLRLENRPFNFCTLDEARHIVSTAGLRIEKVVGVDGFSEVLATQIQVMDEEAYETYLAWHDSRCERPELLGASNHLLFVATQTESVAIRYAKDPLIQRLIQEGMSARQPFLGFLPTECLQGKRLTLRLDRTVPGNPEKKWLPAYHFSILKEAAAVGTIDLRIGFTPALLYCGHIGYSVDEAYRGHSYAVEACHLLRDLASAHGLRHLYITNAFTNQASRRVCEKLGAEFMGTVLLPEDIIQNNGIGPLQNIYRWSLEEATSEENSPRSEKE